MSILISPSVTSIVLTSGFALVAMSCGGAGEEVFCFISGVTIRKVSIPFLLTVLNSPSFKGDKIATVFLASTLILPDCLITDVFGSTTRLDSRLTTGFIGRVGLTHSRRVISSRAKSRPGSDPAAYIASELSKRQVSLTRLRTTRAQDEAAIRAFMRVYGQPYDLMRSSCTTAARAGLEAAGFTPSMLFAMMGALTGSVPPDNSPWPGSVAILADRPGAAHASYERGASVPRYVTAPFQRR